MKVYSVPPPPPPMPEMVHIELRAAEAAELMVYLRETGLNLSEVLKDQRMDHAVNVAGRLFEQLQRVIQGIPRV